MYLKSRKNAKGQNPIYLRVTVDGKRVEKSLNKSIDSKKWDKNKQRGKGSNEEVRILNQFLVSVEQEIYLSRQELINNKVDVNIESLMNRYLGVEEKTHTLIEVFKYENKRIKKLIEKGTYKKYVTVLNHTKNYLQHQYNIKDIDIRNIDYQFVIDFDYYLRTEKSIANNSTIRIVNTLKKIIRTALDKDWIDKDPFLNYKVKKEKVETRFLTQVEIDTIYKKEFKIKRLEQVRDVFIFCCYTGLAYIDVKLLSDNNIVNDIDGDSRIKINRKKTNTISKIPILPIAQEILDKYKDDPLVLNSGKLLPVLSNQKMNAYLKEIGDICEVKTMLNSHLARHSFATIALTNGLPVETLSKVMGHKSLNMTLHYAKLIDSKMSSDVKNFKRNLKKLKTKPFKENKNVAV